MKTDFDALIILNKLDIEIFELRKANSSIPLRIKELNKEITIQQKSLNKVSESLAQAQKDIESNTLGLEESETTLVRDEERLKNISTNREYDAIHEEMAVHRKTIEDNQANILHFKNLVESLGKEKEELEVSLEKITTQNQPLLDELNIELSGLESRIQKIQDKADAFKEEKGQAVKLFNLYARIVKKMKSPYVLSFVNWEEQFCEICQRMQPPQKLSSVVKHEEACLCETCGNFLIWKEAKKDPVDSLGSVEQTA